MNNVTLNIDQSGSHPFPRLDPAKTVAELKATSRDFRSLLQREIEEDPEHSSKAARESSIMSLKFVMGVSFKLNREHYLKLMRDQGYLPYDIRRVYSARFQDYSFDGLVKNIYGVKNVLFTIETPSCHVFGGFIDAQINGVGVYEDPSLRSFLFCMNQTHERVAYFFKTKPQFYKHSQKHWQILRIQNEVVSIGGNDLVILDGKRGEARIGRIEQGFRDNGLGAKMARRKLTGSDKCTGEATFFQIKQIEVFQVLMAK